MKHNYINDIGFVCKSKGTERESSEEPNFVSAKIRVLYMFFFFFGIPYTLRIEGLREGTLSSLSCNQ